MPKKRYPQKQQSSQYQEPMDDRTAQELLSDQLLLLKLIHEKLSVLKQIKYGIAQNNSIFSEGSFMLYAADVLYKGLIIDFAALFGGDKKMDTISLQLFYTDSYTKTIENDKLSAIRSALSKYKPAKNPVKRLINLRNKEVSHYDATAAEYGRVTIRINWDFTDVFDDLFKVAEKVMKIGLDIPANTFDNTSTVNTDLAKIIDDLTRVGG